MLCGHELRNRDTRCKCRWFGHAKPNALTAGAEHTQASTPDYVQGRHKIRRNEEENTRTEKMEWNGKKSEERGTQRGNEEVSRETQRLSETRRQDKNEKQPKQTVSNKADGHIQPALGTATILASEYFLVFGEVRRYLFAVCVLPYSLLCIFTRGS